IWNIGTDSDVVTFLRNYKNLDLRVFVTLVKVNNRGNTTAYEYESFERDYDRHHTRVDFGGADPCTSRQTPSACHANEANIS
ncbi:hypothetical protein, partial [Escherichia coli]|uniref:hypothetical protein n=1 Tax=Escherichia coli TaxID=562 RepID=UPI0037540833